LAAIRAALGKGDTWIVDLQGVDHADSSALAMLLQLMDDAGQRQVSLSFDHMPEFLLGIAQLSNAEELLPLVS
jgi:ABC-type transporter Mla MlaB component